MKPRPAGLGRARLIAPTDKGLTRPPRRRRRSRRSPRATRRWRRPTRPARAPGAARRSPAPVMAVVPVPVIAPARVPKFTRAPLREGPRPCLRVNPMPTPAAPKMAAPAKIVVAKRGRVFTVWPIRTRWPLETENASVSCGDFANLTRVASRLTDWAPKYVSALQHCHADCCPAHPARLARAPVHIRPWPPWQV